MYSLLITNINANYSKYTLFGVIIHQGSAQEVGHYVNFMNRRNVWFYCDDEKCQEVSKNEENYIYNSETYMLFYRQNIYI